MTTTINILIADDHKVVAQGFKALLEDEPGFVVTDVAVNGIETLAKAIATRPDLVLLDVNMPGVDGIATVRKLSETLPGLPVLMLSTHNELNIIRAAFENGAKGYILKSAAPDELFHAIKTVAGGDTYVDSNLMPKLIHALSKNESDSPHSHPKVTAREKEVIAHIAQELTIKEIADKMGVSAHTIVAHKKNLFAKFNVKNSVGLVKAAIEAGVI